MILDYYEQYQTIIYTKNLVLFQGFGKMNLQRLVGLTHRGAEADDHWTTVDDFLKFVRQQKTEEEAKHKPRFPHKTNLLREIRGYRKKSTETVSEQIKCSEVLRHIFHHTDDLDIFHCICHEIYHLIVKDSSEG